MSRTYRRQNAFNKAYYVSRLDEVDAWDLKRWHVADPEQVIVRQTAWFHADSHRGRWSVPRWARKHDDVRIKRKNQAQLRRCLRNDEVDAFLAVPCYRVAGYWFF